MQNAPENVDKTIVSANGEIDITTDIKVNRIFTDYFKSVVEDLCYQFIAQMYGNNEVPDHMEHKILEKLSPAIGVAALQIIHSTFDRILDQPEDVTYNEMLKRIGADAEDEQ